MVEKPKVVPLSGRAREAFLERVAAEHRDDLIAFLSRRLPSRHDAEDVAQETFYRLARKPDLLDIQDPHAFIYRIAVNLLRDRSRREDPEANHIEPHDDYMLAATPSQERVLAGEQTLRRFELLLAKLPPKCRHVFVLHRFREMTYQEIADYCGISKSAVEKHIMRAAAYFTERMDPGEEMQE